jgi:cytochrome P450
VALRPAVRSLSPVRQLAGVLNGDRQQLAIVGLQRFFDHDHPRLNDILRRHRPIARLHFPTKMTAVTRRDDVLAVLGRPDAFVAAYAPHLPGPFVLGMEGSEHAEHRAALLTAVRAEDAARVAQMAADIARRQLDLTASGTVFDVGSDLVHPALDHIIAAYLGVPGPDDLSNRSQQVQWQWAEDLFAEIFLNPEGRSTVSAKARVAAEQMAANVQALMDRRRSPVTAPRADPDDVLGRLLSTGLSEDEIRFSLIGLAIGWLWHGARAALIAVDMLLDDPAALAEAGQAALDTQDPDWLRRVLWEALRFRPVQQFVLRTCPEDAVIGAGTARATAVAAGSLIAVGTQSAMWDEDAIPCPARFDSTRADEQYLIFGRGTHACLGEAIVRMQLPEMLRPLLGRPGLQRAAGLQGRLRWRGARPVGLGVTWSTS